MIGILLSQGAIGATLRVPEDHPTLGAAVAAAAAGDTIEVAPGLHAGPVTVGFDLSIVGTGGSAVTELTADLGTALTLSGASVDLAGVTLTGGADGVPIVDLTGGSVTFTDVVVSGHPGITPAMTVTDTALDLAGCVFTDFGEIAMSIVGGSLVVTGSTFTLGDWGIQAEDSIVEVSDSSFVDLGTRGISLTASPLTVSGSTFEGDAINSNGTLLVEDCVFEGSAEHLVVTGWDVTIRRSLFDHVRTVGPYYAPVIEVFERGIVEDSTFVGCEGQVIVDTLYNTGFSFVRNTVAESAVDRVFALGWGETPVRIEDNEIVDNVVSYRLLDLVALGDVQIVGNTFARNVTGELVYLEAIEAVEIADNLFCDNQVDALIASTVGPWEGSPVRVRHNLIVGTVITAPRSGALLTGAWSGDYAAEVLQNTFAGSTTTGERASVLEGDFGVGDVTLTNNLFVGHSGGPVIAAPSVVAYDLFWDNPDGELLDGAPLPATNLAVDPQLATWRAGMSCGAQDLALAPGSPAIDAGDPSILDADGSPSDIGYTGGPEADPLLAEDEDGDGVSARFDCDDADPARWPGAFELCDDVDQDCDGDPSFGWLQPDDDGDGHGAQSGGAALDACGDTTGYAANDGDCDDADVAAGVAGPLWTDADGDGFGIDPIVSCPAAGLASVGGDCDDADPAVSPDGVETCDGRDEDCDASVDDGVTVTLFPDQDGDGLGDADGAADGCAGAPGWVEVAGDCDDQDVTLSDDCPESPETAASKVGAEGCGCASGGSLSPAWLLVFAAVLTRRGREGAVPT